MSLSSTCGSTTGTSTGSSTGGSTAGSEARGHYENVKQDARAVRDELSNLAHDASNAARSAAQHGMDRARTAAHDLQDGAQSAVHNLENRIRRDPLASCAVAAGIGFLLAMITRR